MSQNTEANIEAQIREIKDCRERMLREMAKVVREAITKLPEREKMIIEARFFKNMKMREIGERFGVTAELARPGMQLDV